MLSAPQNVFVDKMTSMDISDPSFVKFVAVGQYLNNIWSMLVRQVSVQVYMYPRGRVTALLVKPLANSDTEIRFICYEHMLCICNLWKISEHASQRHAHRGLLN